MSHSLIKTYIIFCWFKVDVYLWDFFLTKFATIILVQNRVLSTNLSEQINGHYRELNPAHLCDREESYH